MIDGRLKQFYLEHNQLLRLHMDLLYACDLDCHHCYLDNKSRPQVSTEQIIDTLEQAAALGAMMVTFSGGEIFLRKDLFTILEAARRLRFHIKLKTHGGNLTAAHAQRIKELGVSSVDFSVYALEDEPHDAFTKVDGSLRRTLRGIELLLDACVAVELKCSVTSYNVQSYRRLFEHFTERGVKLTLNGRVRGTNSLKTATYPLNLTHEDKVRLEIYKLDQAGGLPARGQAPKPDESHFCYAGRTSVYVSPNLKVYPCTALPLEIGDLHDQSLKAIWTGSPELEPVRTITRADTGICGTCAARMHCSYCPGAAYIESSGDMVKPPEVICRDSFAKLEAEERYVEGERRRPHLAPAHQPRKKLGNFVIVNQP